jgi:hypothetical protein
MYLHLLIVMNSMYIKWLREVILAPIRNDVEICKQITLLLYYVISRSATLLKLIYSCIFL